MASDTSAANRAILRFVAEAPYFQDASLRENESVRPGIWSSFFSHTGPRDLAFAMIQVSAKTQPIQGVFALENKRIVDPALHGICGLY